MRFIKEKYGNSPEISCISTGGGKGRDRYRQLFLDLANLVK